MYLVSFTWNRAIGVLARAANHATISRMPFFSQSGHVIGLAVAGSPKHADRVPSWQAVAPSAILGAADPYMKAGSRDPRCGGAPE